MILEILLLLHISFYQPIYADVRYRDSIELVATEVSEIKVGDLDLILLGSIVKNGNLGILYAEDVVLLLWLYALHFH